MGEGVFGNMSLEEMEGISENWGSEIHKLFPHSGKGPGLKVVSGTGENETNYSDLTLTRLAVLEDAVNRLLNDFESILPHLDSRLESIERKLVLTPAFY